MDVILVQYALNWNGTHGISHWARVLEIGKRLAQETGANIEVVQLFAVFHDARRRSEGVDFNHGRRGGDFAASLRGTYIHLNDADFNLLYDACAYHTDGRTEGAITVKTCWDADRLDLGRARITPNPRRLCTTVARSPEIIQWANQRSRQRYIPELVHKDWGIRLDGHQKQKLF